MKHSCLLGVLRSLHSAWHQVHQEHKQHQELDQIIKNETMTPYFQPIVHLASGETVGQEVLNRPKKSAIFPYVETFYDFLGKSNQVFCYERTAREKALTIYSQQTNCHEKRKTKLFLNVHPNVLEDELYKQGATRKVLEKIGLRPKQVVFEITEKQNVSDYARLKKVVNNYRSQGFRIAIDDVGSGYNSLKTILHLQPDYIKLDRSFIQDIHHSPSQQAPLFVRYAKETGAEVIAEGIEEKAELATIRELGITFAQGFFIGHPQTSPHFPQLPPSASIASY
ncbi:EAL domain-containing protein [Salipaludibacillus sp. CF4.18]|uniref:EAL domain-containing protein n=1 Tax=Salipaludibacillus sp. CF4.18 TaxID=3373081 RepID=UPI003EE660CA